MILTRGSFYRRKLHAACIAAGHETTFSLLFSGFLCSNLVQSRKCPANEESKCTEDIKTADITVDIVPSSSSTKDMTSNEIGTKSNESDIDDKNLHSSSSKAESIIYNKTDARIKSRPSAMSKGDKTKAKRSVRFDENIYICLIPERDEYIEKKLTFFLWWSQEDMQEFRQDAVDEIKEYHERYYFRNYSVQDVMNILYQPNLSNNL